MFVQFLHKLNTPKKATITSASPASGEGPAGFDLGTNASALPLVTSSTAGGVVTPNTVKAESPLMAATGDVSATAACTSTTATAETVVLSYDQKQHCVDSSSTLIVLQRHDSQGSASANSATDTSEYGGISMDA